MALPAFRELLSKGSVISAWSGLKDPEVHEALLRSPFDALTFDMQHGSHDVASVAGGIALAALLGKPAIVRLPIDDRANAARFLDLGASAVIMPMIETVADAARFVDAVRYPPGGSRSFGPTRAVQLHGYGHAVDYTAAAGTGTLGFAMIETAAALDNLGGILAIEGLDGVFVGPSDLSIALSGDGTWDPTGPVADAAIQKIAAATRDAGKIAAIYAASADEARRYRSYGYVFLCVGSDGGIVKAGAAALAEAARG